MTDRTKIEAALSPNGTNQVAPVIPYEGIFIRDHWSQLTHCPWWYRESTDIGQQMLWRKESADKVPLGSIYLPPFLSHQERQRYSLEVRSDGVYRIDVKNSNALKLEEGSFDAMMAGIGPEPVHPDEVVDSLDEIEKRLPPVPEPVTVEQIRRSGKADLAHEILNEYGDDRFPLVHVISPLWGCYELWGFEGMMTMILTNPELVRHVSRRYLELCLADVKQAAAFGAAGVWIEECMTDMISPKSFAALNAPLVTELVDAIRAEGMKSIYYYCGDPAGKWDLLLDTGADALSLEEAKKGFSIDLEELVTRADGRCAVLGNLSSIEILQNGSEDELRREIDRQLEIGLRNKGRFIMSLGSPVTPNTPIERVRRYCELVTELS